MNTYLINGVELTLPFLFSNPDRTKFYAIFKRVRALVVTEEGIKEVVPTDELFKEGFVKIDRSDFAQKYIEQKEYMDKIVKAL